MTTTRLVTILVSGLWLAGCASRNRQATTPAASVTRTSTPTLFHTIAVTTNTTPVVYIDGEVKRSARFPWTPELALTNAIAMAGGFTDFANRMRLEIHRSDGSLELYNYRRIRSGSIINPALKPNDFVYVPRNWPY